jgi:PAS domain S-box-containing protein
MSVSPGYGARESSLMSMSQGREEQALRQSTDHQRRLEWEETFNSIPDLVALLDADHRVVRANRAMAERLGVTPEQCIGARCYEVVHATTEPPEVCPHVQTCRDCREHTEELLEPRLGGYFLVSTTPRFDEQGRFIGTVHIARDITQRKLAEDRIRRQNLVLEGINRIFREALACDTEEQMGRVCLAVAEQATESRFGFLGEIGPDGLLHDIAFSDLGLAGCRMTDPSGHRRKPGSFPIHSIYGRVLRDGKGFFTNDPASHPDSIGTPAGHPPLTAFLGVPLIQNGKTIGMIALGNRQEGYRDEDLETLKALADAIVQVFMRRRAEEALVASKEAAEAANVAKSQFLANMSHELRTPMNAIMGMTDLALDEQLSPTLRDYLETSKQSAQSLLELLNEILDFSRIEAGRFELDLALFGLRTALNQTLKALSVRADEKGLKLLCDISSDVPELLVGDPLRLRQIVSNLVDNAIKFTRRGQVQVSVRVSAEGLGVGDWGLEADNRPAAADEPHLRPKTQDPRPKPPIVLQFAVTDTGIGISEEDRARIFSPFTQADASISRRYGGTGLGLTIVKRLVALMGGRIWVESTPGAGSTFFFTARLGVMESQPPAAPAEASHAGQTGAGSAARRARPGRRLRVLLAEDTPANQKMARYALQRRGHSVMVANHGGEALCLLRQQHFDVILMDVQMPEMDGFQATAEIRKLSDPQKARLPVIAMTAHALKGDRERCLAAGMDSYISKPIDHDELIETVERLAAGAEGVTR